LKRKKGVPNKRRETKEDRRRWKPPKRRRERTQNRACFEERASLFEEGNGQGALGQRKKRDQTSARVSRPRQGADHVTPRKVETKTPHTTLFFKKAKKKKGGRAYRLRKAASKLLRQKRSGAEKKKKWIAFSGERGKKPHGKKKKKAISS